MEKQKVSLNNDDFSEILKGMQLASKESEAIKGGVECCTECWSSCVNCVIGGCIDCFGCVCVTEGATK